MAPLSGSGRQQAHMALMPEASRLVELARAHGPGGLDALAAALVAAIGMSGGSADQVAEEKRARGVLASARHIRQALQASADEADQA